MATAAPLNCESKSLFSEGSPKFSVHDDKMMAIPIARRHAAASKGATAPNPNVSTSRFPNNPERIATRPFPRNMAFEKVIDSHCCSKPLYINVGESKPVVNRKNNQKTKSLRVCSKWLEPGKRQKNIQHTSNMPTRKETQCTKSNKIIKKCTSSKWTKPINIQNFSI